MYTWTRPAPAHRAPAAKFERRARRRLDLEHRDVTGPPHLQIGGNSNGAYTLDSTGGAPVVAATQSSRPRASG